MNTLHFLMVEHDELSSDFKIGVDERSEEFEVTMGSVFSVYKWDYFEALKQTPSYAITFNPTGLFPTP